MTAQRTNIALTGLQWTLGLVILIEAILFVLPGAADGFAKTHLPNVIRLILGFGEIAGCILMLIPRTAIRGAWLLVAVFALAVVIHLLHGMYEIGNLAIYNAAAWAVAVGKGS
ncbi:MAG: DoxX family protein [Candidatus Sulfotelmatobacter sp.]